ncbi:portal protein [Staphylococcus phage VB-SauS-SA2]|nr:portal protein [Staphylococcus phage VB-SauS-SA2]
MGLVEDMMNGFMNNRNKKEQENNTNQYSSTQNTAIVGTSFSGSSKISEEDALSISSVASATELITSTIARLPVKLYKQGEKGEYVSIEDSRTFLLNNEPNHLQTAITLKKRIILDYLLHGNSYIYPEWQRNELLAIHHIPARNVSVEKYVNKNLPFVIDGVVKVTGADATMVEFLPDDLMIILKNSEDGLQSTGVLDLNADLLSLALNQQEYSSSLLENGSLPMAILTTPSKLSDKAMERITKSWRSAYQGKKNAGKTVVLEEGMDYKPVSLNPNELDLSTSKNSTLSDIARVFGIPESMLNADANKYNSNEQNNLHFLQYTLEPVITAFESALNKSLLLEEEKKKGYSFKFDRDSILATTEAEKFATTIQAMKGGLLSVNEARGRHNMKQILDDYMMWSLGNIFYNKDDSKMTIPNMGAIIDPNDPASLASALGKEGQEKTSPNDSKQEDSENDVSDSEDDENNKSNKDEDIKDEE